MGTVSEVFRRVSQSAHYGSLPYSTRTLQQLGNLRGECEKYRNRKTLVSPALHSLFARSCRAFCVADCDQNRMVVGGLQ